MLTPSKTSQTLILSVFSLGSMLQGVGTASAARLPKTEDRSAVFRELPTASQSVTVKAQSPKTDSEPLFSPRQQVLELYRISGLTWQQLADIFSVSRRSVHHWASGQVLSETHACELEKVYHLVLQRDTGSTIANKKWLLTQQEWGSPFELLCQHSFSQFELLTPPAHIQKRRQFNMQTKAPLEEIYHPPAPVDLFLAQHDNLEIKGPSRFKRSFSLKSLRKK